MEVKLEVKLNTALGLLVEALQELEVVISELNVVDPFEELSGECLESYLELLHRRDCLEDAISALRETLDG